jgi:ribonuclease P/MRP protein subunit POP5
MRSLLPTLKEKKRYLAFEIISEEPIKSFSEVSNQITNSYTKFFGEIGASEAGIITMKEHYNNQKGIIKVNNNYLDKLKTALALTKEINKNKIIFKSLGASGVLNKAVSYL